MSITLRTLGLGAGFLLFAACLATDGFFVSGGNPRAWSSGIGLLATGWLGLFDGQFSWLANPALLLSWFASFFRHDRLAAAAALVAAAFCLSFVATRSVMLDEGGARALVVGYGPGFWLWLASALTLLAGAVANLLSRGAAKR